MRACALALALAALLGPSPARAQAPIPLPWLQPALSTPTTVSAGLPVSLEAGPWVLGEILILSRGGAPISDPVWRTKVRASRGALYTKADVLGDADALRATGLYNAVEPALYEMTGTPVPSEFAGVTASTSQVRLVFNVVEKPSAQGLQTGQGPRVMPPVPLSGVVLTPTAYRGAGRHTTPGLGLDINATYFIGRLYGKNHLENPVTTVTPPQQTNYIDRIGVWLLTADGKMQIQSEGTIRPAVAVGGEGTFLFRDSGQPKVDEPNPTVSVNAKQKSTKLLSDAYVVASKKFGPVRTSVGLKQGNSGNIVAELTEFLSPDALRVFAGHPNQTATSRTVPFVSALLLPKPQYPLAVEVMKFNGAPLNPVLINFKVGYFLHLNFDVGVLKFDGGYDVIGLLQFRYNHFPRR